MAQPTPDRAPRRADAASPKETPPTRIWQRGRVGALLPYVMLVCTMLFWSGNWVVGRAVRGEVPPIGLNFWRWAVALLVLLPFAWPGLRGKGHVIRREWRLLLVLGLTGVALFQTLVYGGLRHTAAINGILLNSTAPLWFVALSWLLLRERVSARQVAGIAVSFLGVFAIVSRGDIDNLLGLRLNRGDLWICAAMPLWAAYSVLLKRRPPELGGLALLWTVGAAGFGPLALMYAAETIAGSHMAFNGVTVLSVLYVGLFASVIAFLFWNIAVERIGPNRASFFMHLMPAFGTILAMIFLGEAVRAFQLVGIALIFLGISLSTSARARPAAPPAAGA